MVLLDSDVMIDLLRDHPMAVAWLDSLDDEILLPGFVVMELLRKRGDSCQSLLEGHPASL